VNDSEASLRKWAQNPHIAVRQLFRAEPDPWQDEVLKDFSITNPDPKCHSQVMQACKNPGKTAVLAWLSWIFLLTRKDSVIGALSITEQNLKDNYWAELARWKARSPLIENMFTWKAERVTRNTRPATWFATARAFSKTADPESLKSALAGLHAERIMFVIDEGGDIPPPVLVTCEAAQGSGIEARILMAGNCTKKSGALYHATVKNKQNYKVYRVTGDPDDPKRAPRVKLEWAKQMIATYGRNNPWVKVDVLSEWPDSDINTLVSPEQMETAMNRDLKASSYDWCERKLFLDVAFDGGDLNVFAPRQGLQWFEPIPMAVDINTPDFSNQITGRYLLISADWPHDWDGIDCTGGYGDGIASNLYAQDYKPYKYQGASAAINDRVFANKVTENFWNAVQAIKQGAALPRCNELVAEFCERTYTSVNGRMIIEPKARFKAKIGRSPNHADAFCGTFSVPDRPAKSEWEKYNRSQKYTEEENMAVDPYDPFSRLKRKK